METTNASSERANRLTAVLASFLPESAAKRERVRNDLRRAGDYRPHAYEEFAARRFLLVVGPLLMAGVLVVLLPPALTGQVLLAGALMAMLGYSLPGVMLSATARRRMGRIAAGTPDAVDMINMCVSQGMSLPEALNRIQGDLTDSHADLAQELAIVAEQARLGTLEHALQQLNTRVDVPELHSLTAILIQTEQLGTSVSAALADYADHFRDHQRQQADQRANTSAFKLLFPVTLCLLPAVFLVLLGPAVIELTDFFENRAEVLDTERSLELIDRAGSEG